MTNAQQLSKKPEMVFLHGWGMNANVWNNTCELLKDRFNVHCVDLPGHGFHAGHPRSADFSLWVDEIAAEAPSHAIYIAWSLGGMLALRLAQQYPEKMTHLILLGTTPKFVQDQDWPHGLPVKILNEFVELLKEDDKKALKEFLMLQVVDSVQYSATLKQLRAALATAPRPLPSVLQQGLSFLRELDLREELRTLHCPLLSIYGQHDRLVSQNLVQAIHRLQPTMRSFVIEGCGHAPFLSHTEQTVAAIIEFLQSTTNSA